jgi:hypothetical protein
MFFDVAGPFELNRNGKKKNITDEAIDELKQKLEAWETGLSEACGCYVFAIRAGKGFTPYYVGQTCKSSILKEALNPLNLGRYNKALDGSNGTPILFLIPIRTPTQKFRKKSKMASIPSLDFLERWLIAAAIEKNPHLLNAKETRFLTQIRVTGILNAKKGEATNASKLLAKTLW